MREQNHFVHVPESVTVHFQLSDGIGVVPATMVVP